MEATQRRVRALGAGQGERPGHAGTSGHPAPGPGWAESGPQDGLRGPRCSAFLVPSPPRY